MKKILFTNDDGYDSVLLHDLYNYIGHNYKEYNKLLIAPSKNCSGISQAITLGTPVVYRKISSNRYRLEGYPSDCVMIGYGIFGYPDLLISGPNYGSNLGQDTVYSGTVAAAREAALHDIPALAFSFVDDDCDLGTINYDKWHAFLDKWLFALMQLALHNKGNIINVNISSPIELDLVEAALGKRHYYNYQYSETGTDHKGKYFAGISKPGIDSSKKVERSSDVYYASKGKNTVAVFHAMPCILPNKMQELEGFLEN